ncbi:MAG: endonuclease III [Vicinamibacteraceae bacterium]
MPGSSKRARPAPSGKAPVAPRKTAATASTSPALKSAAETQAILQRLYGQHPDATTELDFTTPFELLVATILSAQSSDVRVNQVTPAFFKRYPDPQRLAVATTAELEPQIVATGFFRQKSKMLLGMADALLAKHGGQVPADMDALTALPGVGRKTANVVLGHALGVPGMPVDRHVLRVANRIGIAQAATPEEVETQLCAALPRDQWTVASSTLILHGRRVCRPTQPLCPECAVVAECVFAAEMHTAGAATVKKAPASAPGRGARPPHTEPPRRKPTGSGSTAGTSAARASAPAPRKPAGRR